MCSFMLFLVKEWVKVQLEAVSPKHCPEFADSGDAGVEAWHQ